MKPMTERQIKLRDRIAAEQAAEAAYKNSPEGQQAEALYQLQCRNTLEAVYFSDPDDPDAEENAE